MSQEALQAVNEYIQSCNNLKIEPSKEKIAEIFLKFMMEGSKRVY